MDILANLLDPENISSGMGDVFWFAPLSWFAPGGIKKPAPGSVVIEEDYVFLSGLGFVKMVLAPRKNQLNGNTIGDLGSSKMEVIMEVFIPGSYAEVHEQIKYLLNTPLIALCFDDDCPVEYFYNLGSEDEACFFIADFSTGYTHEGNKGFLATLRTTACSIVFYEGIITEKPENLVLLTEQDDPILTEDGEQILI